MRKLIEQLQYKLYDLKDWCVRASTGKLHIPPVRLRDVGPSDFKETGKEFLNYFIKFCNLQSSANVLDIGCGIGRMAIPLASHLRDGSYIGMDVVAESISWCRKNITHKYSNFQFDHIDLFNHRYNPNGKVLDINYRFPYTDQSFDFIILTSVFTHMLPAGMTNYMDQIQRMLADDGQVFFTFFLLNEEQDNLARQEQNCINFKYSNGFYRMRDADIPESAIAYDEECLLDLLNNRGFTISRPIKYGTWSGREDGLSFQDIIIAIKNKT